MVSSALLFDAIMEEVGIGILPAKISIKELKILSKKHSINCGGILALLQVEHDSFTKRKADIL